MLVNEKLKTVFGIYSFSIAYKFEKDLEDVKDAIAKISTKIQEQHLKSIQNVVIKNFLESHKKLIVKLQDMFFIM